ncbi:glycyl radical enzyme domain-containing protein [Escherichia coli]
MPYPQLPAEARRALDEGVICDMFEGSRRTKTRAMSYPITPFSGKRFRMAGAGRRRKILMTALSLLTILYHPRTVGHIDAGLQLGNWMRCCNRTVRILTQTEINIRIKTFLAFLDNPARRLYARQYRPVSFAHYPHKCTCRRRVEAGSPNLTFIYDPEIHPDDLLLEVAKNICECSKPHIADSTVHDKIFTKKGAAGIVSCYNSLPLAGGGSTLVRLNLKAIAERSEFAG